MGLLYSGDESWEPSGPPRWTTNGWELDRVVIPVQGGVNLMPAYIASIVPWSQYSDDHNMFLESYPTDAHKQFPTINLTYTGKKGGTLPPVRHQVTSSLQSTTGIAFSDNFILTFGFPPHWEARITYVGPISRLIQWSRTEPNLDSLTPPTPPTIGAGDIASLVVGGIDYTIWGPAQPHYQAIVAWVLQWFSSRTATYGDVQEVVPGQYWRATVTAQNLLFPVQAYLVS